MSRVRKRAAGGWGKNAATDPEAQTRSGAPALFRMISERAAVRQKKRNSMTMLFTYCCQSDCEQIRDRDGQAKHQDASPRRKHRDGSPTRWLSNMNRFATRYFKFKCSGNVRIGSKINPIDHDNQNERAGISPE